MNPLAKTQHNNVMHTKPDLRVFLKWVIAGSGSVITDVLRLIDMRYSLLFFLPLAICGCADSPEPATGAISDLNPQPESNAQPDSTQPGDTEPLIAWQLSDIVGNKLHLISEPNQIGLFRFDADGSVAARLYDLGMVEMFWNIDAKGRLRICDDDDFSVLHSSLELNAWEGDKALVYNRIKKRKEEYFRQRPRTPAERKLHLEQLGYGLDAEP